MSASWKGHDPASGRRKICPFDDLPCTGRGIVPYDTCRADCAQAQLAMMVSGDIPKPRKVNPASVEPAPAWMVWAMLVIAICSVTALVILAT